MNEGKLNPSLNRKRTSLEDLKLVRRLANLALEARCRSQPTSPSSPKHCSSAFLELGTQSFPCTYAVKFVFAVSFLNTFKFLHFPEFQPIVLPSITGALWEGPFSFPYNPSTCTSQAVRVEFLYLLCPLCTFGHLGELRCPCLSAAQSIVFVACPPAMENAERQKGSAGPRHRLC